VSAYTRSRINAALAVGLAGVLRGEGFRKKPHTFLRNAGEAVQMLNLQSGFGNVGKTGTFTMNLGVHYPSVERVMQQWGNSPCLGACTLETRIGPLTPYGEDHWWTVSPRTAIGRLGAELLDVWTKYGKPWVERRSDLRGGYRAALSMKHYETAAAFSIVLGKRRDAQRLMERFVLSRRRVGPSERTLRWISKERIRITPRMRARLQALPTAEEWIQSGWPGPSS
jgi:hypothetical protein